eukprot:4105890-Amphidinium_carterae.1
MSALVDASELFDDYFGAHALNPFCALRMPMVRLTRTAMRHRQCHGRCVDIQVCSASIPSHANRDTSRKAFLMK